MILADTSVWVDYLRRPNAASKSEPQMANLLLAGQVAMHPLLVAEIALGSLHNRRRILAEMDALRSVRVAGLDEVRHMIEAHSLYAKGIGLTDAHLIASCLLTPGTQLWTRDSNLKKVAQALKVLVNLP